MCYEIIVRRKLGTDDYEISLAEAMAKLGIVYCGEIEIFAYPNGLHATTEMEMTFTVLSLDGEFFLFGENTDNLYSSFNIEQGTQYHQLASAIWQLNFDTPFPQEFQQNTWRGWVIDKEKDNAA